MIFYFPYGGTGTIYFPLQGSATAALTTAASGSLTGTTIKVSIDGGAFANSTNTGTVVGSGDYLLVLTAGETTGKVGIVNIKSSNTIFEDQVVMYLTYGNPSAAIPFGLGTNEVILQANQTTATIGTVAFVATGTVTTITNSVTATVTGTPAVDVVLWKGTAAAGTQGTAIVNLGAILGTAVVATAGTLTNVGTVGTALGTVTATVVGTPAVNAVQFLGTAIVGTQGTLTNIGTAGTALGTVAATVAFLTSSRAELSAIPATSVDLGTKIDFLYMVTLNTMIQGSGATSTLTLRNGAGTGAIGTRTIIDDGVTLTSTKWA